MKLRIGHLSTVYHTALLLAADKKAELRLGAEIEWKLMGTGPEIMQAFRKGEIDAAYAGLPPAIIAIDQGIPVVCIAGGHMEGSVMAGKSHLLDFTETGDLGAVLGQFRGQRLGVPGKGSIHDVILKDSLERHGLDREVGVINYPWADMVMEAVVRDEVAAAVGTPALAAAIRRFALGKVLYPPSRLWPHNPSYGVVVNEEFLRKETRTVERFLRMHEEATDFIRNRPREASELIADHVGIIDQAFVLDAIGISPRYCAKLSNDYISSAMKFVPVLRKLGYIRADIPVERIFFRDLIEKIHPEKDHYSDRINMD